MKFGADWSPRDWYFFVLIVGLALCGIIHEGCNGIVAVRTGTPVSF